MGASSGWVEARDVVKPPAMHGTALQQRSKMSIVLQVRNWSKEMKPDVRRDQGKSFAIPGEKFKQILYLLKV